MSIFKDDGKSFECSQNIRIIQVMVWNYDLITKFPGVQVVSVFSIHNALTHEIIAINKGFSPCNNEFIIT